jgi:hypothetical protein
MHRAVKKCGSQVLLKSEILGFKKKAIRLIYRNGGSTGMKERFNIERVEGKRKERRESAATRGHLASHK